MRARRFLWYYGWLENSHAHFLREREPEMRLSLQHIHRRPMVLDLGPGFLRMDGAMMISSMSLSLLLSAAAFLEDLGPGRFAGAGGLLFLAVNKLTDTLDERSFFLDAGPGRWDAGAGFLEAGPGRCLVSCTAAFLEAGPGLLGSGAAFLEAGAGLFRVAGAGDLDAGGFLDAGEGLDDEVGVLDAEAALLEADVGVLAAAGVGFLDAGAGFLALLAAGPASSESESSSSLLSLVLLRLAGFLGAALRLLAAAMAFRLAAGEGEGAALALTLAGDGAAVALTLAGERVCFFKVSGTNSDEVEALPILTFSDPTLGNFCSKDSTSAASSRSMLRLVME